MQLVIRRSQVWLGRNENKETAYTWLTFEKDKTNTLVSMCKQRWLCLIEKATFPRPLHVWLPSHDQRWMDFLLFHRDIALWFEPPPCEWRALCMFSILTPSTNGGSRTVLVGPNPASTQRASLTGRDIMIWRWEWRGPGEYLMTQRPCTPLYTTMWLMDAASSSQTNTLRSSPPLLLPLMPVWSSLGSSKRKETYTLT